ncbi:membrane protein insertion efficiency factor YidD [Salinispira pacifica]|uniref:Putative membrane protein insertion efficiency factor n=1 Tax=Salinispira pacifica TaxID=1307761 RepID=V5WGC8_9SPIO|nr:membrane protein insertion efficiency factor YidD [Salinispira pacifica]AHC14675.1 Protein YidD [Salinispira pacifica]
MSNSAEQQPRAGLLRKIITVFRWIMILPILLYQRLISPMTPGACRYHPSCSEYGKKSIMRFGVFAGGILAVSRMFRCWGWFSGGHDPVPDQWRWKEIPRGYRKFYSGPGSGNH